MANKMLIDATHPEETRVVVLRGNRVEEFDFESAQRKQLRGNIYLAKVTRVEPSLQAAFVDYGGNRHGFLAFSEIHPDYYQIPVADRQALIEDEERAQRALADEDDRRATRGPQQRQSRRGRNSRRGPRVADPESQPTDAEETATAAFAGEDNATGAAPEQGETAAPSDHYSETFVGAGADAHAPSDEDTTASHGDDDADAHHDDDDDDEHDDAHADGQSDAPAQSAEGDDAHHDAHGDDNGDHIVELNGNGGEPEEIIESVGGADAMEEVPERTHRPRRQYKIQEVIKRRQVMLVQVVKEERGTKGAALTTYLSLAGRYSVLMPNTARGGGISRKITDAVDRRRLKEVAQELEVPEGMGVILRTAGASRTKTEVKRDFEYLLRLWETVRDLTLKSTAPTLVYEEGSLVKRAIRDLYNKDIEEIVVAGDDAYKEAKDFMRMLMPSHAKNVKGYKDALPVFTRHGIESQLDAMFTPIVQLKSGGYIVLNQTEALVAIDVNSGRATREHHIEDTALKTNLEAADEVARQLRLRDLAGLIVIDFIDMEEKRNNRTVERRVKEALKNDRARIQVGHISHFGLLEMSRQRIRSSVLESSTEKCPSCGGTGHIRSVSSVALQLLRSIEETLMKGATHNLIVRTRTEVALYVLNHKRAHLRNLEERFQITISISADETVGGQQIFIVEKGEQVHTPEQARALAMQSTSVTPDTDDEEDEADAEIEADAEAEAEADTERDTQHEPEGDAVADDSEPREAALPAEARSDGEHGGRKRRRRRGRRGEPREGAPQHDDEHAPEGATAEAADAAEAPEQPRTQESSGEPRGEGDPRRRRRGRRGGRRNRRNGNGEAGEGERPAFSASGEPEHGAHGAQGVDEADTATQESMAATVGAYEPRSDLGEPQDAPAPRAERRDPEPRAERQESQPQSRPSEPEPVAAAPRRRSTIREPAPFALGGDGAIPLPVAAPPAPEPASAPEPAAAPAASEEGDRPRRAGWWSRKVLGKE